MSDADRWKTEALSNIAAMEKAYSDLFATMRDVANAESEGDRVDLLLKMFAMLQGPVAAADDAAMDALGKFTGNCIAHSISKKT